MKRASTKKAESKTILMKKFIAVTLYVVYAVFITLFIVFGSAVSRAVVHEVKCRLYAKEITDVELNITPDDVLMSGVWNFPVYTAVGDFYDPALKFESLDPSIVHVNENGAVYAYHNYEGDSITGRIRITSEYNASFEKIVTFTFGKVYPERFDAAYTVKSYGANSSTLYMQIPVYVYAFIPSDVSYNVYEYEVLYDERYFTQREDGSLLPIATTPVGETTTVGIRYQNGASAESQPFAICPPITQATAVDEIRINSESITEYAMVVKRSAKLTLYYQGQQVHGDYDVTFGEGDEGYVNAASNIYFQAPGEKTVTITLPNGFSETFIISVRNRLALPTLEDEALGESRHITILNSDLPRYYYAFPSNVTCQNIRAVRYDESLVTITATTTYFTITPKGVGTTAFSLLVSDGYEELWMDFTLEIQKDTSLSFYLIENVGKIVAKYIGHLTLFVVLAFFALNMFRYIQTRSPLARFVRYTLCALPIAAVTEYWQTFIPGRTGAVEDVLVDMGSYYLGTLIGLCFIALVRVCRKHREKRHAQPLTARKLLSAVGEQAQEPLTTQGGDIHTR